MHSTAAYPIVETSKSRTDFNQFRQETRSIRSASSKATLTLASNVISNATSYKYSNNHTIYVLKDESNNNKVEYVGRTRYPELRKIAHEKIQLGQIWFLKLYRGIFHIKKHEH